MNRPTRTLRPHRDYSRLEQHRATILGPRTWGVLLGDDSSAGAKRNPDLSRGAVWVQRGKAAGLGGEGCGHCGPVTGRARGECWPVASDYDIAIALGCLGVVRVFAAHPQQRCQS